MDAFNRRFPAFESYNVPEGAFRSRPATPDDTVTTLAVTYRLVAPDVMLDLVAGTIARTLFTSKPKLIALTPLASQIEAPDPDAKNPILPIHPGVAHYLSSGEQSFFDELHSYFYLAAAVISVLGSGCYDRSGACEDAADAPGTGADRPIDLDRRSDS